MSELFISYAREDVDFVLRLHDALAERGRSVWVDWESIPPSAEWWAEVEAAITSSEATVFVISPASIGSEVCDRELLHAVAEGKRLIPVLREDVSLGSLPDPLSARNWVLLRDGDPFDAGVDALVDALDTDLEWVHDHTRLLVRAKEWEDRDEEGSLLLRGSDLDAAERFLAGAADREPPPTPLQTRFVVEGRRAATGRQRRVISSITAALLVTVLLAIFALVQRQHAVNDARVALSREYAVEATQQLDANPELALQLAVQAGREALTPQARDVLLRGLERYREVAQVAQRGGPMNAASFSPDRRDILTGGDDGTARIWDVRSGNLVERMRIGGNVLAAWSPDGSRALAWGTGGAGIWELAPGSRVIRLVAGDGVSAAAWSSDGRAVALGMADGGVRLWDPANGMRRLTPGHAQTVTSISWEPDGGRFVTTSRDGTGKVWSVPAGGLEWTLRGSSAPVVASDWNPGGGSLVTVSGGDQPGHEGWIWDPVTGRKLSGLHGGEDTAFTAVEYSPDGRFIATTGTGGAIGSSGVTIFSASGGYVQDRGLDVVTSVDWRSDGRELVTGDQDGEVRVYRVDPTQDPFLLLPRLSFFGHAGSIRSVDWSPGNGEVVSAGTDGTARVWKLRGTSVDTPDRILRVKGIADDAAWDPRGTRLVTASGTGSVQVWDPSAEAAPRTLGRIPGSQPSAFFASGGRRVVGAGGDTDRVWDSESGRLVVEVGGSSDPVTFTYSSARLPLFATTDGREATIWDARTGHVDRTLNGGQGTIEEVVLSGDGRAAATAESDGTVDVWSLSSHAKPVNLDVAGGAVCCVDFSPDGRSIVTASADGAVNLVRIGSSRARELLAPGSNVNWVRFADRGRYVAAHAPGGVWAWDVATGASVPGFPKGTGAQGGGDLNLGYPVFSADGSLLGVGTAVGSALVWDLATGSLVADLVVPRSEGESFVNVESVAFDPTRRDRVAFARDDGAVAITTCRLCLSPKALLRYAEAHLRGALTVAQCRLYLHTKTCPS
jgi:WD40 repeat protein